MIGIILTKSSLIVLNYIERNERTFEELCFKSHLGIKDVQNENIIYIVKGYEDKID